MTYFTFLLLFVVLPATALTVVIRPTRAEWGWLGVLAVITYVWTTPWDNYLVGSGVWYYDPQLVSGIVLGWVPLEEYLFFGLQVWLSGLWTFGLRRVFTAPERPVSQAAFLPALGLLSLSPAYLSAAAPLIAGVPAADLPPLPFGQWNYLVLILAWALPVILGQIVVGGEVFLANWRVWLFGSLVPALYLTAMDSIALGAGTWAIAPAQSLNVFLPLGVPLEEGLFFLVTNVLITQGLLLFTSPVIRARLAAWLGRR
jgi:lycopene cyclase domain-containing protein